MKNKKIVFLLISTFLISFQPVCPMEKEEDEAICLKGTCSDIKKGLKEVGEGAITFVVFNETECSLHTFFILLKKKYAEKIIALYLAYNNIASLFPEIKELSSLKILDLHGNNVGCNCSEVIQAICSCRALKALRLSKNALQEIPQEIKQLESLTDLDLSDNKFKTFPETLTQLPNLKVLNLGNNVLRELSPQISQLKNLESLNLHGNALKNVPQELGRLSRLTRLYLQDNCLNTEAIKAFCLYQNLQDNLETLALEQNKLESLPPEIGNLRKLKHLFLRRNKLKELPREIGKLNLETLDLIYNELTSDAVEVICSSEKLCAYLKLLNLACNKIEEIPQGIERLGKIEKIRLFGNGLEDKKDAINGALPNVTIEF